MYLLLHHVLITIWFAVPTNSGTLEENVLRYRLPAVDQKFSAPSSSGKKPGKIRKRVRTDRQLDRSTWEDMASVTTPPSEKPIVFTWLKDNSQVKTCHGCSGQIRPPTNAKVLPPPPMDIVLRKKMYRSYRARGSTVLKLTSEMVNCYFHVERACCDMKDVVVTHDNYSVEHPSLLRPAHTLKLRREFGIVVNTHV